MTTTAPRANPRRPPSLSAAPTHSPSSSISRGATARSAASPRTSSSLHSATRRPISRPSSSGQNGDADTLSAELKEETEKREKVSHLRPM